MIEKENEERLAEQARKQRERLQRDSDDIRYQMGTEQGRRVVWWLLERGKVFASTFTADPQISAFNEGQRNIALALFSRVMTSCPELYLKMAEEAREEENL